MNKIRRDHIPYPLKSREVIYCDLTNGFSENDFADLCLAAADQAMISVKGCAEIIKILEEEGRELS